eukprot:7391594-Pyramimonas_sp.AAC.1
MYTAVRPSLWSWYFMFTFIGYLSEIEFIRFVSMDLFQFIYLIGLIFGGRGGPDKPILACLGLLSYSFPFSLRLRAATELQ